MPDLVFPDGFLWGASTSSYQIEGGNAFADWHHWENAGRVPDRSGSAADSWNRFRQDVDLAVELGHSIYRISCEWSRIEPEPGVFDDAALARYADWLGYARGRGLQTMLVLWHFTNPAWLSERGAWADRETPLRFEAFVRHVVPAVAPYVDWWATINEANTYANHGWLVGSWPPGRTNDFSGGFAVYRNLAEGHRRARSAIKEMLGDSTAVGLTHVVPWAHPAQKGGAFSLATQMYWNWLGAWNFLDRVRGEMDWLGVQYYYDSPCKTFTYDLDDGSPPRTDMGWRICPEGLYRVVKACGDRYGVPMLVTENGLADASDSQRSRFIIDHLSWLHRAVDEGYDVRGYLHWSLLDNFEWAYGFEPRFGLVKVDYSTHAREIRPSGRLFARIAGQNRIEEGLGAELRYADGAASLAPKR
ncbi:MAG TPA: family 1 glycosylhydrolase [Coriobacteriia bacterium]|nr:family 1 glycosylhydrolase [Coriobacteriia bacterium]